MRKLLIARLSEVQQHWNLRSVFFGSFKVLIKNKISPNVRRFRLWATDIAEDTGKVVAFVKVTES
jgi:hypothetical protein